MILAALLLASRFQLQSNFWVSLHQRLAHEAATGRDLTATTSEDWKSALDVYRRRVARRDLFDPEVVAVLDALSVTKGDTLPPKLPDDIRNALAKAAPVYRKTQWAADDRANRFAIATLEGILHDSEEELIREHERVYGMKWPQHVRVDLSPFAGPVGGFTTGNTTLAHTTLSSLNPTYRCLQGLEMILHESSHAVFDEELVSNRAKYLGVPAPRDLWHAILFYTSGEITKRVLATRGVTDYQPVGYTVGVYKRGEFPKYLPLLETIWHQHINGEIGSDEAIDAMVRQLTQK